MATHAGKERRMQFAREYAKDFNASEAAIRAGYAPGRAKQTGSELLKDEDVAAEVRRLAGKLAEKAELTAERTMAEIAAIAYAAPTDTLPHSGNLTHKLKALDQAMSILGMHKTNAPVSGGVLIQLVMSDGKPL